MTPSVPWSRVISMEGAVRVPTSTSNHWMGLKTTQLHGTPTRFVLAKLQTFSCWAVIKFKNWKNGCLRTDDQWPEVTQNTHSTSRSKRFYGILSYCSLNSLWYLEVLHPHFELTGQEYTEQACAQVELNLSIKLPCLRC